MLYQHQRWLKQQYSNLEKRSLQWIKFPVIFYSAYWIGWNLLTEFDRLAFDRNLKEIYFLPSFVGLAIATYLIGFRGYTKPALQSDIEKINPSTPPPSQEMAEHLKRVMQSQRPYLDPDLDLTKLAELLEMNPKQVSHLINSSFSKNFYEFINGYRVEAFKARMKTDESHKLTLLGNAYECGFKSKSTFNEVFKKLEGKTPSAFVKNIKKTCE